MPSYQFTIERLAEKADPFIHSEDTWETVCSPIGEMEQLTGRELVEGDQTKGQATHRFRFRWGPSLEGFSTADRIMFRNRRFELVSVKNAMEQNRMMECMAIERG